MLHDESGWPTWQLFEAWGCWPPASFFSAARLITHHSIAVNCASGILSSRSAFHGRDAALNVSYMP